MSGGLTPLRRSKRPAAPRPVLRHGAEPCEDGVPADVEHGCLEVPLGLDQECLVATRKERSEPSAQPVAALCIGPVQPLQPAIERRLVRSDDHVVVRPEQRELDDLPVVSARRPAKPVGEPVAVRAVHEEAQLGARPSDHVVDPAGTKDPRCASHAAHGRHGGVTAASRHRAVSVPAGGRRPGKASRSGAISARW
jgi:hypothetical protein